jgi:betaine-homocysteine S-methyltransferase
MRDATTAFVACQPVGYKTADRGGCFTNLAEFPLALDERQVSRFTMAKFAREARSAGIDFVGGCCGVVAHHVRAMAEALGRKPPAHAKSANLGLHAIEAVRDRASSAYWDGSGDHEAAEALS